MHVAQTTQLVPNWIKGIYNYESTLFLWWNTKVLDQHGYTSYLAIRMDFHLKLNETIELGKSILSVCPFRKRRDPNETLNQALKSQQANWVVRTIYCQSTNELEVLGIKVVY